MTKKLMIVESPSKAKKIQAMLGSDWIVKATVGHIRDLPEDEMGVDVENGFIPKYVNYKNKAKTIKYIKSAMLDADEIYLALDPDREGEAIAWHTQQALKIRNGKRITFSEINKKAIQEAVQNPRQIDMPLVNAQETRRILDRLFGYIVSPILCKQGNQALSAGRVQSPALRLLFIRQEQIDNFKPKPFYELQLNLSSATLNCVNTSFQKDDVCFDKNKLIDIQNAVKEVSVTKQDIETKISKPRPCFTTSTLQQASSSVLKNKPKTTMTICQKLFENGLITYHRTDSPNLSDEKYDAVKQYLSDNNLPIREKKPLFKSKANAQEAHEAICPTDMMKTSLSVEFSDKEKALYALIHERTMLSAMPNAIDEKTTLVATSTSEDKTVFSCSSINCVQMGWREHAKIQPYKSTETIELPDDIEGTHAINLDQFSIDEKKTKAPSRYNEASFIKALEKLEIGRPSTYAAIVDGLYKRKYIVSKGKNIEITELGKRIVNALDGQQFMDLAFTQKLEAKLDDIAHEKATYVSIVSQVYSILEKEKNSINFV